MIRKLKIIVKLFLIAVLLVSCSDNKYEIEHAAGYPSKLAGNWVVFEFQGGSLDGIITGPYDMSTALMPNDKNTLVLDNLYNSGTRIKVPLTGDSAFIQNKAKQLEVINKGGYGIETVSIDGYISDNFILKDFIYQLAVSSMENIAFTKGHLTEIIFYRAGFYDRYNSLIDSVMVMGYRKTGFEEEDYK
jgi:hypothetical protein